MGSAHSLLSPHCILFKYSSKEPTGCWHMLLFIDMIFKKEKQETLYIKLHIEQLAWPITESLL